MATEITTAEVFQRALLLPAEERAQLATQLLLSLESAGDAEQSSTEQIIARFRTLDARLVVAVTSEVQERGEDRDEPFGARLA